MADILLTGFRWTMMVEGVSLFVVLFLLIFDGKKIFRKRFVSDVLTPGFFTFLVLCTILWFIHTITAMTDVSDFAQWGMAAKEAYFYNSFISFDGARSTYSWCPPASYLWSYFNLHLVPDYYEQPVYAGHSVFMLACLAPVLSDITSWRDLRKWAGRAVLVVIIPVLVSVIGYSSLNVDVMAGILCIYIVFTRMFTKHDGFRVISMALAFAVLSLTEDLGMLMAGILAVFFCLFSASKSVDPEAVSRKRAVLESLTSLLASLLAGGSWILWLSVNHVTRKISFFLSIFGLDYRNRLDDSEIILEMKGIKDFLLYTIFDKLSLPVPLAVWAVLPAAIVTAAVLHSRRSFKGKTGFRSFCGKSVFLYGLYFVFALWFTAAVFYYRLNTGTIVITTYFIDRICTWLTFLLGSALLFVVKLIPELEELPAERLTYAVIALLIITTDYYALTRPLVHFLIYNEEELEFTDYDGYGPADDQSKVWFVAQPEPGLEDARRVYLAFRYHIMPTHVNKGETYAMKIEEQSGELAALPPEDWLTTLVTERYQYIYIYHYVEEFPYIYGGLFQDTPIKQRTLYRVIGLDGAEPFRLEAVEQ